MSFKNFRTAIAAQFQMMTGTGLFRVDINPDDLWKTYLESFPEGSNPVYKKRTEHDCGCCRSFVRTMGGVVSICDGSVVTIWDGNLDGAQRAVADSMSNLVRSRPIENVFLHSEKSAGTNTSRQLLEDKSVKTWDHFFVNLPVAAVAKKDQIGPMLADSRATHDVMLRGLREISPEAIDTVLELIAQNSLYRGEENRFSVDEFRKLKAAAFGMEEQARDLFVWSKVKGTPQSVSRIRNTSIGTLLTDLSEDKDIGEAVASFESKVAPANYKRPTSLVTKAMVQKAQAAINEMGFASALERRYATLEDITVNNILFADRAARKSMSVFEEISAAIPVSKKNLDRVAEVGIEEFIDRILPSAESLEVMAENRHAGNFVSLIAPCDPTAKDLFKWPNNFSWSYTGDVTDSIKERVKLAGGRIDAFLRCSLSWFNYDDLDLHLTEPGGREIYYASKVSPTGGQLDVDMNAGSGITRSAVENIFYPDATGMKEGIYTLAVHNFARRETQNVGFDAEMEIGGVVHSFSYANPVRDKENVIVAKFQYTRKGGVDILGSLPSSQSGKEIWGVRTQTFHRANVVMLSPNHWDERAFGNRHYFFMLDGCRNEGKARGIYNEFLHESLAPHRKVFEVVGSKMKTEESDRQLSGLGFSSTQRNHLMCRVIGSFTRTVKVTF